MIDIIVGLINTILTKIISLVQQIYDWLFGDIDFTVLYNWLPADIRKAAAFFILLLFGLAIWRVIKSVIPFL